MTVLVLAGVRCISTWLSHRLENWWLSVRICNQAIGWICQIATVHNYQYEQNKLIVRGRNNIILCAGLRKERVTNPTITARTCTRQTIICQWTGILADVSVLNPKYMCNCFDLSLDVLLINL